jgi:ABC-type transporter Mla MlaB component
LHTHRCLVPPLDGAYFSREWKEAAPSTVIDVTNIPDIDSTGIGKRVNYNLHCRRIGSRIGIIDTSEGVMELFIIACVDSVLLFGPALKDPFS